MPKRYRQAMTPERAISIAILVIVLIILVVVALQIA